ncbi:hypothetical protein KSP39_PZI024087 [Platanthera zijinensis]|uniref:Uncharacterized protein n=1 Tax=Platanthera zijinensis TaxID=2320716 RepID=A0AAP0ASW5_9ASPA
MVPKLPQNIPLLYDLVWSYIREKEAILLGQYFVSLTVNEIAFILVLSNTELELNFVRWPFAHSTEKNLIEELRRLVTEEWSPTLKIRRVNILVKYLVVVFFSRRSY